MSVVVPVVVPLIEMEVPGRVSFVSEVVTVPEMVLSCARPLMVNTRKTRASRPFFSGLQMLVDG